MTSYYKCFSAGSCSKCRQNSGDRLLHNQENALLVPNQARCSIRVGILELSRDLSFVRVYKMINIGGKSAVKLDCGFLSLKCLNLCKEQHILITIVSISSILFILLLSVGVAVNKSLVSLKRQHFLICKTRSYVAHLFKHA